ncbi:MAG: glycosyltransferase family 39 protein [Deltaproteobacteria bacterium]|nr:glycosyltransferase family 39 protein [Deltaproteobacteria bacterium]
MIAATPQQSAAHGGESAAPGALDRRVWLAVAGLALAVRLVALVWSWSGWQVLPLDYLNQVYFDQGRALAAGGAYLGVDGQPELLHPPGMALLLAGLYRLFGTADVPVQLVFSLTDAAAAGLLAWLLAHVAGPRIGKAAGVAYALWLPAVWGAVARSPDGGMALAVLGALACAFQAGRTGRAGRWGALAGVCLGVISYLRPDYLFLPVFLGAGLWFWQRKLWSALQFSVVAQVLALLLLLPWAHRNHQLTGRWIFTSTSVGATLVSGLGAFSNPWGFGYTDGDRKREVQAAGIASQWSSEADLFFRKRFAQAVAEHPGAVAVTVVKRLPLALAPPQTLGWANPWKTSTFTQDRAAGADRYQVLLRDPLRVLASYGDVLFVGLLNLGALLLWAVMAWRQPDLRPLLPLLTMPHAYGIASHLVVHFEPRYVLPSAFVLAVAVGWAVATRLGRR